MEKSTKGGRERMRERAGEMNNNNNNGGRCDMRLTGCRTRVNGERSDERTESEPRKRVIERM